jgi:hypothetical protein
MKINVISISRDGVETNHTMELEHYLKAKKVQPDRWKPGDKEAKVVTDKFNDADIPIGTTPEDVAKFEANKGQVKGKGQNKFAMLLKAAEDGTDIADVPDVELDNSLDLKAKIESEMAPKGYKSDTVEVTDPEDVIDKMKTAKKETKSKYVKEDLMKLSMDKVQAIAEKETAGLTEKMKKQILKTRKKENLVDSIIQLSKK